MVPLPIPTKYIMPCKTNGCCRAIYLHDAFPKAKGFFPDRVQIGMNFIAFAPYGAPDFWEQRVTFKCCTGCKLPFNRAESARINELIGLELPSAESLRERLARLKSKVKA